MSNHQSRWNARNYEPGPDALLWQRYADMDRAAEARIGGNVYRREGTTCRARGYTRAETDEYMAFETRWRVEALNDAPHATTLPEAAFDWPIYRLATAGYMVATHTAFATNERGEVVYVARP